MNRWAYQYARVVDVLRQREVSIHQRQHGRQLDGCPRCRVEARSIGRPSMSPATRARIAAAVAAAPPLPPELARRIRELVLMVRSGVIEPRAGSESKTNRVRIGGGRS